MKLSKAEEELMNHIWKLEQPFMKDLLNQYKEPKPATTTIATLLKRMTEKKFIAYTLEGKSRRYFPLVKKRDYFSNHLKGLIQNFFDNSTSQFASFFTEETDLSEEELKALRRIINQEIKKKQA